MGERKRINISVDTQTYERLQRLNQSCKFRSVCKLIVVAVGILLARQDEEARRRRCEPPEGDADYIKEMFDDMAHAEPTPERSAPPRHHRNRKSIEGHGKG